MQNNYDDIKQALISIGFEAEKADMQISELGNIIKSTIFAKMCMDHEDKKDQIEQDPEAFLKENYSDEEIKTISSEVSTKIVKEYLDEITKGLDESAKSTFYSKLGLGGA